jgi:hypothetical protein
LRWNSQKPAAKVKGQCRRLIKCRVGKVHQDASRQVRAGCCISLRRRVITSQYTQMKPSALLLWWPMAAARCLFSCCMLALLLVRLAAVLLLCACRVAAAGAALHLLRTLVLCLAWPTEAICSGL